MSRHSLFIGALLERGCWMLLNFLVNNFNVFWSDSIADKGLRVAPIDYRGQCKQFMRH